MKILLIGLGGFIGSVARFYTSKWTNLLFPSKVPFGTVVVNVAGSFIIGFLMVMAVEKLVVNEDIRLFIGVGVLGGFTTFSTFSVETMYLLEEGSFVPALIYIGCNLFLSLLAAYGGMLIARSIIS
ncbi:fluoride efflux transporter CrcB [Seleniivibrio woodruffii]|uniref:Fluoride-specific ion channel FluC n=1 Tax=Seleniivibrio woodruffii TaxID=1078050 RepID=A0A4R1K2Q5_9BACT|nr:fluoride efflux transporter CrcB [Seleniivibrio woodruffii]TCK58326.1 protein CrcB [Seleniivibrio woodruffii]TVZ36700.1 camphor resistance protein CrcB [Seleniivibrio woodruffii]